MDMKLSYMLTKRQLTDFGEFLAVEAPTARVQLKKKRKQLLLIALAPAAVAVLSFIRVWEQGSSAQLLLGVGCVIAAGAMCITALRLPSIVRHNVRRQMEQQSRPEHIPETTLDLGSGVLVVEERGQTSILPLRQYSGCEKRTDCRYLLFGARGVCVPEAALTDAQWEELTEFLHSKI